MSGAGPGDFREPLRVVSDLHLGHPRSPFGSVESLRPLFEGARTVVFNGDTCEMAHAPWRDRSEEMLGELRDLIAELGIHPVFLTGNHDYGISELGWLELRDGAVLVTHGDMLLPEVVPWSPQLLCRKREVRELLLRREERRGDLEDRWETTREVERLLMSGTERRTVETRFGNYGKVLWPPQRPFEILRGWATMFASAERFVSRYRPGARVFVFGHFHRPGIRVRGSRLYVNTGALMREARQVVVDLEDEWLTVRSVVRKAGGARLGPPTGVYRLTPAADTGRGGRRGPVR